MDGKMNRYNFFVNYPASPIDRTTIKCVKNRHTPTDGCE